MTALPFILALLAMPVQVNPQRQVGAAYRISGVVVDSVTNAPVARAQLSISLNNEEISTRAGDDGRFVFAGLEPGKYVLNAVAPGYVRESYNQHGSFFVAIAVGDGQDSEHLVFRLHPQAVIYGKVTDERGDPVRDAQVRLFASDLTRGSHAKIIHAQMQTNDLGEYRFAHLLPGRYYLAVEARPWYAQTQLSLQMSPNSGNWSGRSAALVSVPEMAAVDVVYPITFYPGVTEERSSAELVLTAGEIEQANITVQAVPAARLRLTSLPVDDGSSLNVGASQKVFGTLSLGMGVVSGQISPGEYEIAGLPPGEITVVVNTIRGGEWSSRTMEADTSSGGTLDASALQTTARVSGRILLAGGGPNETAGNVILANSTATTFPSVTAPLKEDGTFHFPEIQPGTYRVQVNLHVGGYYLQKVSAKEAKVSGREITVTGTNDVDLTITMGQGQGQVTGIVQLDGKAVAGVMVLLVPESGLEIDEDSRMDESDSDGTFSLRGILPGEYVLMGIKDGWDLEWAKPGVLKPFLPAGQKLSIAANQSVKVTVASQEKTSTVDKKRHRNREQQQ